MTFYLKYRPQNVSELDLTSVRETLKTLLSRNEIPHAFLFAGPRGTGKTSAARILAKAINCENKQKGSFEPCNECETCRAITRGTHIDVIEMDAASNRRIDEVRALKQDIMLSPTLSKKKVYIIDEVHMLTTEAANALLKTLEEPPSHVVFVLATTDPQKLPQTVVSRLSVVQFHKADESEITAKLKRIVENEKIEIEESVFPEIFNLSDGSFRDAVKILEEFALQGGPITRERIEKIHHTGSNFASSLLSKLHFEGVEKGVAFLGELEKQGVDGKSFLNSFMREVHGDLLKSVGIGSDSKNILTQADSVKLLELLLEANARMAYASNDFLPIEIALVKFKPEFKPPQEHIETSSSPNSSGTKEPEKKVQNLPTEHTGVSHPKEEASSQKTDTVTTQIQSTSFKSTDLVNIDTWGKILVLMRERNASVEALLRATHPRDFDGKNLTLGVYFQFHKERLEMPGNKILLEEVLAGVFDGTVTVDFILEEPPAKTESETSLQQASSPDIINAAKEIFGN